MSWFHWRYLGITRVRLLQEFILITDTRSAGQNRTGLVTAQPSQRNTGQEVAE